MTLNYRQEFFPTKELVIILEIPQCCNVEVLKLSCIAQIYLVWDHKYEAFYQEN